MDSKKLNIQLDENVSIDNNSNYCDESLEYTVVTMQEIETFTNIIKMKDNQIKDVQDKLSDLEIQLSIYKERANIYNEKIKDKDDLIAALHNNDNSSSIQIKMDKLSDQLETYFDRVAATIKNKDELIENLQSEINSYQLKLNEKDQLIEDYKSEIVTHESTIKTNFDLQIKIIDNQKHVEELQTLISLHTYLMSVPGIKPFHVQIEDNIAGPDWIVIQRRVNGKVSFDNDLDAYHEGFGDPKGDFWLGLEKIHRITTHKQHELYIHIVDFDNATHYTQYDNFVIGNKDEQYLLKSLGSCKGNVGDMMQACEKQAFRIDENYNNGWWWKGETVPLCNLNGILKETVANHHNHIFWGLGDCGKCYNRIKSVQMLIRQNNV